MYTAIIFSPSHMNNDVISFHLLPNHRRDVQRDDSFHLLPEHRRDVRRDENRSSPTFFISSQTIGEMYNVMKTDESCAGAAAKDDPNLADFGVGDAETQGAADDGGEGKAELAASSALEVGRNPARSSAIVKKDSGGDQVLSSNGNGNGRGGAGGKTKTPLKVASVGEIGALAAVVEPLAVAACCSAGAVGGEAPQEERDEVGADTSYRRRMEGSYRRFL